MFRQQGQALPTFYTSGPSGERHLPGSAGKTNHHWIVKIGDCDMCPAEGVYIAYGWSTANRKHCITCNNKRKSAQRGTKEINKKTERQGEKQAKDWAIWTQIWKERPHYCYETGVYLGTTPRTIYFSHILSKGAHPELRHNPKNIVLHSPGAHHQWEFGDRKSMKTFRDYLPFMIENGYVLHE